MRNNRETWAAWLMALGRKLFRETQKAKKDEIYARNLVFVVRTNIVKQGMSFSDMNIQRKTTGGEMKLL